MLFVTTVRSIARSFAPVALIAGLAAGCGDAPSEGDCQKLLEHLVELEVSAGGAKPTEGDQAAIDAARAELAKQKKAIVDGASAKFLEACVDKTPKAVVTCALAAKTLDDVAKCDSK